MAYAILLKFDRDKSRLDDLLDEVYANRYFNKDDRRLLKNLTSGVLRHLLYLDWMAARFYKGNYKKALPGNKIILRLAFYELLFIDHIPAYATLNEYVNMAKNKISPGFSRLVNGLLRNFLRQKTKPDPEREIGDLAQRISIAYSFPLWMVKRWIGYWGEEQTEQLCRSLNRLPQFDLVINEQKIRPSDLKQRLSEKNIAFRTSEHFKNMISTADIQAIREMGCFERGECRVQDESARIAVELLDVQKDDLVLDVCAAPGGKYTQILQAGGKAVAVDVDMNRLKKVKQNTRRQGVGRGLFVCADARHLPFRQSFSKILVDAPCSGLGVIRKHPDIKWRRQLADVLEFSQIQQSILNQSSALLRAKGRLVYSTCTIDFAENEYVADEFLRQNPSFSLVSHIPAPYSAFKQEKYLRTFPHLHKTDGSFCAVFQKKID